MLSKFLNTKTLIILLVVLVGIYLLSKLSKDDERSFKSEMVTIDTTDVTKIVILPKLGGEGNEVSLTRTGQEWKLESDGKTYKPDMSTVNNVLRELMAMKSERVAATDDTRWAEFEVTDSTATRIKLFNNKKLISDLYIGKFNYVQPKEPQDPRQQQRGKMSTFVRPAEDKEVYVVDGFIKMSIQANVDNYRDKTLCSVNKNDLTTITFRYPNSDNFVLKKEENKWFLNGQEADSIKTLQYLNKLAKVTSSAFIDDVEPLSNTPSHFVKVEGNNILPIELKAFPADSVNKYVVTSTLVPNTKYSGQKSGLFDRVFADRNSFFKGEED
ncbi:MAG: DUF4340 domain-containing protein [Bacteroidales bacterium]